MVPRGKNLKGIKKRPKLLGPQTDQQKTFCERWLIHYDKDRAWREAGYSPNSRPGAIDLLNRFADYLRPIREAKAKLVAERIMVDSEAVLQKMVKQTFFDPTGFYERSSEPLTEWIKVPRKKEKIEQVMTWDGKPVYGERMKPYSELTPEQQAVVEITRTDGDRIQYRLPSISERHTSLTSLGRQFGMFAEKLIVEKHNHQHQHHHLDFSGVPSEKLADLTRRMLPLVGIEFARQLGYTPEDMEAAAREEGVIIPQRVPA